MVIQSISYDISPVTSQYCDYCSAFMYTVIVDRIVGGGASRTARELVVEGVHFVAAGTLAADHGLGRDWVARLARQGKVRGRQFGSQWFLDDNSFKNYLVHAAYERAARREQLTADRQREYRIAQAAVSENRLPAAPRKSASPSGNRPVPDEGALNLRILGIRIHFRLDRAERSS